MELGPVCLRQQTPSSDIGGHCHTGGVPPLLVAERERRVLAAPFRYVWPSELDLMARLAGMTLVERWCDWDREPFTAESRSHISVCGQADLGLPGDGAVYRLSVRRFTCACALSGSTLDVEGADCLNDGSTDRG